MFFFYNIFVFVLLEICMLPAESGHCPDSDDSQKRWYYDDSRGNCISFIYFGCSGNQNNFRSFESCEKFCKPRKCAFYVNYVFITFRFPFLCVFIWLLFSYFAFLFWAKTLSKLFANAFLGAVLQ